MNHDTFTVMLLSGQVKKALAEIDRLKSLNAELVEALEGLLEYEEETKSRTSGKWINELDETLAKAHVAIAKAKGEGNE